MEAPHIWENNVALCQKHEKGDGLIAAVDNDGETLSVPKHLADLFQRSSHLLNPDERSQLAQLLTDFVGVFAASSDDVDRTSLVTHQINTGFSQPVSPRYAFHYINEMKPTHCSRTSLKRE